MTTYSKSESDRLVREAREDDERMGPKRWCHSFNDHPDQVTAYEFGRGAVFARSPLAIRCAAIARTRNNLSAIADQLAAAGEEIARLRSDEATMKLSRMIGLGDPVRPDIHAVVTRQRDAARAEVERLQGLNRALHDENLKYHQDETPTRRENRLIRAQVEQLTKERDEATAEIETLRLRPPMACSACEDHNLAIYDENRRIQFENDELRKVISEDKAVLLAEHRELRAQMHEVLDALMFAGEKVDMNFESKDAGARTETLVLEAKRLRRLAKSRERVWEAAKRWRHPNGPDGPDGEGELDKALRDAIDAALEAEKAGG